MSNIVRSPKINLQVPAASLADGARLRMAINDFPTLLLHAHANQEPGKSIDLSSSDLSSAVAAQQKAMFEEPATSSAELEDGNGNTVTFTGTVNSPEYKLGVGRAGNYVMLIQEAARMASLNTWIYGFGDSESDSRVSTSSELEKKWASIKSDSIAERMSDVLDIRTEMGVSNDLEEEIALIHDSIDINNEKPLELWKQLLGASSDSTALEGLDSSSISDSVHKGINKSIDNVYTSVYSSWQQGMQNLCAMFNFVYVPALDGVGQIKSVKSLYEEDPVKKSIDPISISINGGISGFTPVKAVAVSGGGPVLYRSTNPNSKRKASSARSIMAIYPPDVSAETFGTIKAIGSPAWLNNVTPFVKSQNTPSAAGPNASSYKPTVIEALAKLGDSNREALKPILEDFAKNSYINAALADSIAIVTVPLDYSWQLGTRYQISSDESNLFKGNLVKLEHSVSSNPSNPIANTTLIFSLIEAEGFTLIEEE